MLSNVTPDIYVNHLRRILDDEYGTAYDLKALGEATNDAAASVLAMVPPLSRYNRRNTLSVTATSGIDDIIGEYSGKYSELPDDYASMIQVGDDFPATIIDEYDASSIRYATEECPVALIVGKYLVVYPSSLSSVVLRYRRGMHPAFEDGEDGVFTSTTTLTPASVVSWVKSQWIGGFLYEANISGAFTETAHLISGNATGTITSTGLTNGTYDWRLFNVPDVPDSLIPAVMYESALLLESGDTSQGLWSSERDRLIQAFMAAGGRE